MFDSCLIHAAQTTVQVGFEQTRYTGTEGGSVEVCIRVIEGSFNNSTTLILIDERNEVGDTDTAFEFQDYSIQEAGPLTNEGVSIVLNSTRTRGCISINLREDAQLEGTELFTIELSDNSEAVGASPVLNPNQTVVNILDNTGRCLTVTFQWFYLMYIHNHMVIDTHSYNHTVITKYHHSLYCSVNWF